MRDPKHNRFERDRLVAAFSRELAQSDLLVQTMQTEGNQR